MRSIFWIGSFFLSLAGLFGAGIAQTDEPEPVSHEVSMHRRIGKSVLSYIPLVALGAVIASPFMNKEGVNPFHKSVLPKKWYRTPALVTSILNVAVYVAWFFLLSWGNHKDYSMFVFSTMCLLFSVVSFLYMFTLDKNFLKSLYGPDSKRIWWLPILDIILAALVFVFFFFCVDLNGYPPAVFNKLEGLLTVIMLGIWGLAFVPHIARIILCCLPSKKSKNSSSPVTPAS